MSKHEETSVAYEVTIKVRDTCLCLHVQRAARAVARRFDIALRPLGLTNGQFSLLMSLNRPKPPGMASVAALLAMDRTTLTANLKPLERRGLVGTGRGLLRGVADPQAVAAGMLLDDRVDTVLRRAGLMGGAHD